MVVVVVREGDWSVYDGGCGERGGSCSVTLYSCGWVLYILFYLLVLYSVLTPHNIPGVRDTDHHFTAFSMEAV